MVKTGSAGRVGSVIVDLKNFTVSEVLETKMEGFISKERRFLLLSNGKEELKIHLPEGMSYSVEGGKFAVKDQDEKSKEKASFYKAKRGTLVRLIRNAVLGLTKPFEIGLKIVGVGYKYFVEGTTLKFKLGYSHDVEVQVPKNITVKMNGASAFTLISSDNEALGHFASQLSRNLRKYNVYSGKGILIDGKIYAKKAVNKK